MQPKDFIVKLKLKVQFFVIDELNLKIKKLRRNKKPSKFCATFIYQIVRFCEIENEMKKQTSKVTKIKTKKIKKEDRKINEIVTHCMTMQ
jgi:hypothetical protein